MKIVSSREVYKCGLFRVTEEEATDPGGFHIKRSIVRHMGSAVMMAVDEKNRILLVRQFRLPAAKPLRALPAGPPSKEEAGDRARNWRRLPTFWPSAGFVAEKMTIFLATGLTAGEAQPMDDERIECRWFARKELDEMIRGGKIEDGKTIIGFLTWLRYK